MNKKIIILTAFLLFSLVCLFLFSKIKYQESILVMIPSSISSEIDLFQKSPLSNKVFVVVNANEEDLNSCVEITQNKLKNNSYLTAQSAIDTGFILSYYYYIPALFSKEMESRIAKLITQKTLNETNRNNIMNLFSPQGFGQKLIFADPIGMLQIALKDLQNLNITNNKLTFNGSYLANAQNTKALLIYETLNDGFDRQNSSKIINGINLINKELPKNCNVFAMGTARYTQENNSIILKDVKKILCFSIFLLFAIFLWLFRQKNALFIYFVPVLVFIPAAVLTYFKFGFLSGITLGFGSVLMGLAIDYSIYVYFAFKSARNKTQKNNILKKLLGAIFLSASTSILSFLVLYFCDILLFKQLAFFAVSGLLYALFIAFVISPLFFKAKKETIKNIDLPKPIKAKYGLMIIFTLIIIGALSVSHLKLNFSLETLNTSSKQLEIDRNIFNELTGYNANKQNMLFVFGKDKNEAIKNSEFLLTQKLMIKQHKRSRNLVKDDLPMLKLFVSKETIDDNIKRWKKFWDKEKIKKLKNTINSFYASYAVETNVFNDFYRFLQTAKAPQGIEKFDLTKIYNPFIKTDNQIAMLHILPQSTETKLLPFKTLQISQNEIQNKLTKSAISTLSVVTIIVFLFDLILLIFVFKNMKLALIAFIPILATLCVIASICALFSIEINLFSLFSIPLILGLSIDYAIFIIHQSKHSKQLFPSVAVLAASLLSLAGFGALVFANHKVLFSIGLILSIGITISSLISIYILPDMVKKALKILPIIILLPFLGCKSLPEINYNVATQNYTAEETQNYQGVYNNSLSFFSVVCPLKNNQVRIITLNEFGIKLCDMTISKHKVDVHNRLETLPKSLIKDIAKFYEEFFFEKENIVKNVMENNKITYKNITNTIIFWRQDEHSN